MKSKIPLIKIKDLKKTYHIGKNEIPVLKGVNLEIKKGEMVALMGPSGSGKTTLLNMLGLLDIPDSGSYYLDGEKISKESNHPAVRNQKIGFVFQTFNLLPRISAISNVEVPLIYAGVAPNKRRERAEALLDKVGLSHRINNRPNEMSGGERQRVAIARALVNNPKIILADEPTGNIDSKTGKSIMKLLKNLNRNETVTQLIVTHEKEIAEECGRIIRILDGKIIK